MKMKYRELLIRYKKGFVNDEEKQLIEQEIEKFEAIEEYLSEVLDEELDHLTHRDKVEDTEEETTKLRKSVNDKLRNLIFTSAAIVIASYLMIFFIVSPLVDALYYNPNKFTVGKLFNDISFDVLAIAELNFPGFSPSNVLVDKQRFGKYDVTYSYSNVFTDESYNVIHKIEHGKIKSSINDPILEQNLFKDIGHANQDDSYLNEKRQNIINYLKKLNPLTYVSMEIMFKNDITMEELYNLQLQYPDVEFEWAGIRTDSTDKNITDVIGIPLKGRTVLLSDEEVVSAKYPGFFILGWLVNPVGFEYGTPSQAQAYEHHYISLLEYVVDRKEAVKVLEHRTSKYEFYKSALEYANNNEVKSYGVLLFAEVEDLLNMIDNEEIKGLEFRKALVSKSYGHGSN